MTLDMDFQGLILVLLQIVIIYLDWDSKTVYVYGLCRLILNHEIWYGKKICS